MGNSTINMMSEMIDILEDDIDKHDIISIYAKLLIIHKWAKSVISDFISFILQDSEEDCQLFINNMVKWDLPENDSVRPLEKVDIYYTIDISYTPTSPLFRGSILKKGAAIDATRLCNNLFDGSIISEDLIIKEGCTEIGERALNLAPASRCKIFIPKSVSSISTSALPNFSPNVEIYFAGTRKQFTDALYHNNPDKTSYWIGLVQCSDGVWESTNPLRI